MIIQWFTNLVFIHIPKTTITALLPIILARWTLYSWSLTCFCHVQNKLVWCEIQPSCSFILLQPLLCCIPSFHTFKPWINTSPYLFIVLIWSYFVLFLLGIVSVPGIDADTSLILRYRYSWRLSIPATDTYRKQNLTFSKSWGKNVIEQIELLLLTVQGKPPLCPSLKLDISISIVNVLAMACL